MDIQKEREAFESYLKKMGKTDNETFSKNEDDSYQMDIIHFGWKIWQAAKAQAVPEGYVLVKTSDRDQEMLELIDQRDHMEGQAEELKDKLQALYGVNFGEHSSCNFPFQNAIDYDDSDLVLVPREPNEKMIMNGLLVISTEIGKYDIQQEVRMIWEKMIEAQEPAND